MSRREKRIAAASTRAGIWSGARGWGGEGAADAPGATGDERDFSLEDALGVHGLILNRRSQATLFAQGATGAWRVNILQWRAKDTYVCSSVCSFRPSQRAACWARVRAAREQARRAKRT